MAGNTKGTPAEIHAAANRHRASADMFRQDNQSVQSEVDGLTAINRGDLMTKLDQLQNDWSDSVKNVTTLLSEMADYLDKVANEIESQDATGGSGLR